MKLHHLLRASLLVLAGLASAGAARAAMPQGSDMDDFYCVIPSRFPVGPSEEMAAFCGAFADRIGARAHVLEQFEAAAADGNGYVFVLTVTELGADRLVAGFAGGKADAWHGSSPPQASELRHAVSDATLNSRTLAPFGYTLATLVEAVRHS